MLTKLVKKFFRVKLRMTPLHEIPACRHFDRPRASPQVVDRFSSIFLSMDDQSMKIWFETLIALDRVWYFKKVEYYENDAT